MSNNSLKNRISSGFRWSFTRQIFIQAINFIFGIFLARLLLPSDFGLVAMIMVFIGFASVLNDFGFSSAIIHFDKLKREETGTAFWFSIILSILLTLILYLSASLIAGFYDLPILKSLTQLLALNFFISGIGAFPNAMLIKDLRFKTLFWVNTFSLIISSLIAIYMALHSWGVYSIIARTLVGGTLMSIMCWIIAGWSPQWVFRINTIGRFFSFTLPLLGDKILNYFVRNVDNLLIGKYLGNAVLGNYYRAYSLMLLPVRQITGVFSTVLFPSLSLLKADREKTKALFLKVIRLIAFLSFPAMMGLAVLAEPFVLTLLGPNWEGVIPILKILSFLGAIQSIGTLQGSVFLSQGATQLQLWVGLVSKLLMIVSIILGLQWGVIGLCLAYAIASGLAFFLEYHYMGSLIDLSLSEVIKSLSSTVFTSIAMAGVLYGTDEYLVVCEASNLFRLLFGVFIGTMMYFSYHIGMKTSIWRLFIQTLKEQLFR